MATTEKGNLTIHTENIFPIIKKWLYSEHDIFIRELVANAVDAMQKRKAIGNEIAEDDNKIIVKANKDDNTIQIIDSGIGMDAEEIKKYINQIAFSGAEDFVSKFKDKQANIIGHFGLGFYSSFIVAAKVTIDSLSCKDGSKPAYWECDGTTDFSIGEGKRNKVGTTITLYLNDENKEYLEESKLKEIVEKFCNFMPFPIEIAGEVVNQTQALWQRNPKDITDEEYKEFYRNFFNEMEDPLFWIHLNVDHPFRLKGILYFPKIRTELDLNRGKVKLYCNNVFVAENLKDFIPEFLLLLRGGIDVPDIPLNVSRSFLQHDKQVKKITKFIIKKVADHFKNLFADDRKQYEEMWDDIQQFAKFGILTNPDFYEAIKDMVIFKTSSDDWVTLEEYLDRNKQNTQPDSEKDEESKEDKPKIEQKKVYYAAGKDSQVTYQKLMKDQGFEVVYSTSSLDTHLFQHIESRNLGTNFVRIDSEINETLVDEPKEEVVDADNKTASDKIKDIFKEALNNDKIEIQTKSLKSPEVPAMLVFNEHIRRFSEMNNVLSGNTADLFGNHTLMLNTQNPTVKNILSLKALGKTEKVTTLCNYVYQLSLLEQKKFSGNELQKFIENSAKVLSYIK